MWNRQRCIGAVVLLLAMASRGMAGTSLGLSDDIVGEHPLPNAFPLVESGRAAALYVDPGDFDGVRRAATDLREDIGRVTRLRPEPAPPSRPRHAMSSGSERWARASATTCDR